MEKVADNLIFKNIDFENDSIAWVCHVGSDMRNLFIIDGFFKAADLIYKGIKNNDSGAYEDILIYPFLHTIRHVYELQLKSIMYNMYVFYKKYKYKYIIFDEQTYEKIKLKHDIGNIYKFIKNNYFQLDERCNEDKELINNIYNLILDFIPEGDIDPYRYAEDRQGKENMANIVQVSFDNVYKSAKKFMTITDSILNRLSTLFNEYKLGTYYETFSRNQIMMIAKELPIYKNRNDSSFKLIKDNIKKKYNMSGCKLSAIINIIKNSRRLSYYIKYNRNEQTEIIHLLEKFILENLSMICNFDDSKIIVSNKEIDLNIIQIKHKEAMDFLSRFSIDDMAKVFSYYKMGCKISHPEDFEKVFNESVEYFNNSEISEARKYFITKLQGRNFINFIMHGVYASGDYEIFLALLDFLKKETTFPTEQFDKLKEDLE